MSGGSAPSTQTSTQITDLPEWAKPYAKESLGKAAALTDTAQNPYQAYTGDRIAGFNELQKQAFTGAENMMPSAELGQAGGIAGAAAMGALGTQYRPVQTGQFTGRTASQYMSPFVEQALAPQLREAQRTSEMQRVADMGAATKSGAFGGGRQAIVEAERQRNLGTQLGDIRARGLQDAYTQAQQQFNTEQQLREQSRQYGAGLGMQGLQTALTGAGQLANIGQQGFAQQMDINKLQQQYGTQQQQLAQAQKTQQYEDFLNQQRYPYQQLEFMSNILRGTPMGTVSSLYAPGVSGAAQTIGTLGSAYSLGQGLGAFAAGGEVKGYAKGGTSVANPYELQDAMDALPDEGVDRMARVPGITALAKMQIEAEQAARNKMRAAFAAQQSQQQQPQMTVAEEMMSQLDQGLGGAPLPDDFMSAQGDSGIVAMAGGGDPEIERLRARSEAQRNTIIPGTSGASPGTARNTDPTGTVKPAATAGGIFGPLRAAQDEYAVNTRAGLTAWEAAQPDINLTKERHLEGLRAAGEYGTAMEAGVNEDAAAAEAALTQDRWLTMSEAFAKMASTPGTFMQSLAEGLGMGAKEIRGINNAYAKLARERNEKLGLIKEKRRAEEMGLVDKAAEYDRKIADQQLAIEDKRLEIGEKLAASGVNVEKAITGYNAQLQQASINKGTGADPKLTGAYTNAVKAYNDAVSELQVLATNPNSALYKSKKDLVDSRAQQIRNLEAQMGIEKSILSGGAGVNSSTYGAPPAGAVRQIK